MDTLVENISKFEGIFSKTTKEYHHYFVMQKDNLYTKIECGRKGAQDRFGPIDNIVSKS